MIDGYQIDPSVLPFARSYDSFKHTTGIALLSLGGFTYNFIQAMFK